MRPRVPATLLVVLLAADLVACSVGRPRPDEPPAAAEPAAQGPRPLKVLHGKATWYGPRFHGRKTANGERYNQNAFTAAHRTLPFGTRVRVINKKNGKSVQLRINDRGPFGGRAIIDVSRAGARQLDMISDGVVPVRVEVLWIP